MTTLDMTPSGVSELMLQEGTVLHWYPDATGTQTCLTGHTNAAGAPLYPPDRTFTRAEGASVLAVDLARIYMPAVSRLVTRPMLPHQADAFGSFTFNAGAGNFAGSSMLRCFNAGDIEGAADGFLSWTKSKGVVLSGLVKRRQVERGMFLDGTYPGVTLAPADTTQAMKDQHMIAKGATGDDVVTLQTQLTVAGYAVKPDGSFGAATDNAVREFQSSRGLPVDGVVGLKTWMALDKAQDAAPVATVTLPKPAPVIQPVVAPPHLLPSVPVAAWWQFWKRNNA